MEISDIKKGDLLFVWGTGFVNEAIEFITHGSSHCAIFIDDGITLAEAQAGMKIGSTPLSSYLKWNNRLEVYRDSTLTDAERVKIVNLAKEQFGEEYDYLAILFELAHFELGISLEDYHEGKRRICSSYIYDIGLGIGRNWSDTPYVPAPVDILKSGKLQLVGKLK